MNVGKLAERNTERRDREALWWFARLQDIDLTERLLGRWNKWYAVPENRRAFDDVENMSRRLKTAWPSLTIPVAPREGYDGSQSVQAWNVRIRSRGAPSQLRARFAAATIALAAAAAAVVIGLNWTTRGATPSAATMETEIAEHKELTLGDGSKIFLGAKSAVSTEITSRARTIVLSRGEALFQVARDPARPFRVMAGSGSITAIGTAFNVRRREDGHVVVTVTEGAVRVAPAREDAEAAAQKLMRGQELTYGPAGRVGPMRLADAGLTSDWRNGRLRYRSEPLRNVVPDLGRYSRRPLVLTDAAAGELLFSGTVYERDVDEWVAGLERIYPGLEVTLAEGGRVLIRTRR